MYDIAVVGAGVIGTAIARELMRYNIRVALVEKGSDVALGASKANSGIVHAGYDAPSNSWMSYFNVRGNAMYDQVSSELDIPFKRIGSLLLAFSPEEVDILYALKANGEASGIVGLEVLDKAQLKDREPNILETVVAGLYAPSCGIIEPWEIAIAYAENAVDNGCDLFLDFEVNDITRDEATRLFTIHGDQQKIEANYIINAGGIYADAIYKMVAPNAADMFDIKPRRGQYFLLDKSAGDHVKHVLFPCPTKLGKGTLVLPTIDGNLLVGPDSELLEAHQKEAVETTGDRLELVKEMAQRLVSDIPFREVITTFSGLRAESTTGDFIVGASAVEGFYQASGIKSPGLSSAPAIGVYLADLVTKTHRLQMPNPNFNPVRRKRIRMHNMDEADKQALIQKDSRFGRIICRCEEITEGEIMDVITRSVGAKTVNGVKRRARPGAGRCQGGFCMPRVMEILSKALDESILEINLEGKGSSLLIDYTKGGN